MPFDPARAKALFLGALELPGPDDRPGFLDLEIGDNADLRRRVEQLLAAYDQPAAALDRPRAMDPTQATLRQPDAGRMQALPDPPLIEVERTVSFRADSLPPAALERMIQGASRSIRQPPWGSFR